MDPFLNIRTLALLTGLVSIALAVGMVYFYRTRKTYPGFFHWVIGSICCGLGSFLLCLRGNLPDFITIILANLLVVVFYTFILWGLEKFTKIPGTSQFDFVILATFTLTFLHFTYWQPSIEARIVIICLVITLFCFKSARVIGRADISLRSRFIFWTLMVIASWNLLRIVVTLFEPLRMTDFMAASSVHGLAFVVIIVSNILLTTGFMQLNHNRLEVELNEANDQMRESEERLQGLADATYEGILFLSNGVVVEANRTLFAMFGYAERELIGKPSTELIAGDERKKVRDNILAGFEGPYETLGQRRDGSTFPMEVRAKMFSYRGEEIRVAALRDLTDVRAAEEEIDTLRSILPICAFCKKIRDDQGYWRQVEEYFKRHSRTDFTHGVCNDCMATHYPDAYKKINKRHTD